MKKFKEIKEAKDNAVVFSFGRFNPPTTGHEKLLKAADSIAKAQGADLVVFPSQSQDPKKNPLSFTDKVKFMRKMFRNYAKSISSDKSIKTAFDAVSKLYDMGYRDVTMVVGGDRVAEFDKLLNKYNGIEGRHGFYDFEGGVKIKSAGNRADPDSDEAKTMTADAMSASVLRNLAVDGDFETFKKGVPDTLGDTDKRVLFNKIRTGMKLAAINEMFELLFDESLLNEEGELIIEKAPPDADIEKWLEKDSTKAEFKKRYGDKWQEVMYATAWKMYNDKNKADKEEWNIDEELDEDWKPADVNELFEEEFKDYTKLSFSMLREKFVKEDAKITQSILKSIEQYADKLFAKLGIDVEFTRHFLDRVNDERNKKQITQAELIRLFKQTHKQYGKKIAQLGPDAQAVINDMQTDVNMPFVLKWDDRNQELDLVAKTVMRKKNFQTSNQKLVVSGDNHSWKSTGHYTKDGVEWHGDQHYNKEKQMVMTGKEPSEDSEPLYHYKDLPADVRKKIDAELNESAPVRPFSYKNRGSNPAADIAQRAGNAARKKVGAPILRPTATSNDESVAQDKDIKDREGTQPAKYYAGDMSKSTKEKRAAQFKKQAKMDDDDPDAYKPAPGDASAKTKPSKHTKAMQKKYPELYEDADESLKKKAEASGISYGILKKVFDRGVAAWRTGHRPGTTAVQWGHARVNSFITGGKTRKTADADLWKQHNEALEEGFAGDTIQAIKLLDKYRKSGKDEDAFDAISFGWQYVKNPKIKKMIVGAVEKVAKSQGLDWEETVAYIKRGTGIDVTDIKETYEEAVSPEQQAAIAIAKKEKQGKKLKEIREAYIEEVTSNNLPQIGDVDMDGFDDDPYQDIQVRFMPFAIKIKGFPEFILWSQSVAKVRSTIRLTLKRMDDIEYIERITDAEARQIHKRRYDNPNAELKTRELGKDLDGDGIDDAYKTRQDAYYREALEYGSDELVKAYKEATPGEDLNEAPQWVKELIAKYFQKNKYEKAAQGLLKYVDKVDDGKKHSLGYYAAEIIRMSNSKLDARILAKAAEKILATEAIFYAKENGLSLYELYRPHSDMYYAVFEVARELQVVTEGMDKYLIEQTDIGEFARYDGELVPLDIPLVEEAEPELNSPKRGGSKKFYVYVKNEKGNTIKVEFGDTSGLKAKINDPEARKSFVARHDCENKKDKTTPGYWSCRLPMYAKELGLEGGGDFFW